MTHGTARWHHVSDGSLLHSGPNLQNPVKTPSSHCFSHCWSSYTQLPDSLLNPLTCLDERVSVMAEGSGPRFRFEASDFARISLQFLLNKCGLQGRWFLQHLLKPYTTHSQWAGVVCRKCSSGPRPGVQAMKKNSTRCAFRITQKGGGGGGGGGSQPYSAKQACGTTAVWPLLAS